VGVPSVWGTGSLRGIRTDLALITPGSTSTSPTNVANYPANRWRYSSGVWDSNLRKLSFSTKLVLSYEPITRTLGPFVQFSPTASTGTLTIFNPDGYNPASYVINTDTSNQALTLPPGQAMAVTIPNSGTSQRISLQGTGFLQV